MTSGSKNQESNFCLILTPLLRYRSLAIGRKIHLLNIFLRSLSLFTSFVKGYFRWISCMFVMKEFVSRAMFAKETGKLCFQLSLQLSLR